MELYTHPFPSRILFFGIVYLFVGFFSSCKKESDSTPSNPDQPSVRTDSIGSITFTTAKVYSTILAEGKSAVTSAGVAWATTPDPTVFNNKILANGYGVGSFSSDITNLIHSTTYYVRTFATNSVGTTYGPQKSFTTNLKTIPLVSTNDISGITSYSANGGGNIIDRGSDQISRAGLCWGTSPNPTINLSSKTNDYKGAVAFNSSLISLTGSTTYYIRAYASNTVGTGYGEEKTITTLPPLFTPGAGVSDNEGNLYATIIIGSQEWMKENLKAGKYRNGEPLPANMSASSWPSTSIGACADYGYTPANSNVYGKLYNYYAVADPRGLCPVGWHIPSDAEWTTLINLVGDSTVAGGKLRTVSGWDSPNLGAVDAVGFSAIPSGHRDANNGSFVTLGNGCGFWSSTETSPVAAWARYMVTNKTDLTRWACTKRYGWSIRCVKD